MKAFITVGGFGRALVFAWAALAVMLSPPAVVAQQPPPNTLVIMADDIGYWNISAYNRGQMGYRTPNIDRIANDGAILTDYYGQQFCTAGRAAFITGQRPMRTGLRKVGLPGPKRGCRRRTRRSPICSNRSAIRPDNSARTIWAIATNSCRPF